MWILVISLIVLAFVAAAIELMSKHDAGGETIKKGAPTCATCDGTDTRCEQECMMEAATKDIEYFDDEELDAFRGRTSDAYSDKEVEQFRDVMYTMQQDEVKEWNRSLILRNINIPDQLKDELIMLIREDKKE